MASTPAGTASTARREEIHAPAGSRREGPSDVATLVHRIHSGDRGAETMLVERFSRGLLTYLRGLGCAPELAEDFHQESFRILLERLRGRGLEEPAGLPGFLRGTARNLYLADRRKSARRRTEGDEETLARASDPRTGQLHRVLDAEAAILVRQLIAELEIPRDRQILFRFYIAEDRKEAICRDLGLSGRHFDRVLFRARKRFRELLEAFEKREKLRRAS